MRESRYNIWVDRGEHAYVFNSLSGALLRLSRADQHALHAFLADGAAACPPRVLGNLAAGSMLIPDDADELATLAQRYHASRHDGSLFALTIVTSLGCNFDCPYCFEAKHPSILDADVQALVLAAVDDQLTRVGGLHVTWFGGEPLVGKKPLLALSDAFIERADRAGAAYGADIVTNGYLLDEATCEQLRARRVGNAQVGLDGPPDVHDRMRPLADGRGSFWTIVRNPRHAVEYFSVAVRVNIDARNFDRVEELFALLAREGFAGKLSVYPGQIVGVRKSLLAPSASYGGCFGNAEFARAEHRFMQLAAQHGLGAAALPRPSGAPCTAVRANELVVGSRGELYKCWSTVGEPSEVVGHIRDYGNLDGRLAKWLAYDPFGNDECRACVALPVCMGGCAHHAFDRLQYENRCGTFRHTYRERIGGFVEMAERHGGEELTSVASLSRRMETR